MTATLIIARLTVAEAARRRILWVLLGLTVLSVALTTFGLERLVSIARERGSATDLEIQVGVSQVLILVAFMFSFVLAMTAAFLGAPAIAAGAICVVAFGLGWMAGVMAGMGRFFDAGPLVGIADAARWLLPTDVLWRGTVFGLEPPAVVLVALGRGGPAAEANPFFASAPPPTEVVVWSIAWVAIVLVLSVVSLGRRDL